MHTYNEGFSPAHPKPPPMNTNSLLLLTLLAPLTACASSHAVPAADPLAFQPVQIREAARNNLLDAIKNLEGNWQTDEGATTTFEVTSAGSVVREILFAGQDHEMTNMYSLEGNSLKMVHYCGLGNQPEMRATSIQDSKIVFSPTGVSDRLKADETYMGSLTLTLIDDDTINASWTSFVGLEAGDEMAFDYKRID